MTRGLRIALLIPGLVVAPALAQETLYVTPDVPTDPAPGTFYLPWDVAQYAAGAWTPPPELTVPGDPAIDGIHKRNQCGHWLFSVEAPSDIGGLLPGVLPRDVVEVDDNGVYSFFFCGGAVADPVLDGVNVDALYQDWLGGDEAGALIVSFDAPVTITGIDFMPGDLARYDRSGPCCAYTCVDWKLAGKVFDASVDPGAAWTPSSDAVNLIGASQIGTDKVMMAFDIPTDLAPLGGTPPPVPAFSEHVVVWDPTIPDFNLQETLTGYPVSSLVDGLSCEASPGRLITANGLLMVNPSTITSGDLTLTWGKSCASGAEDYGVYEGTLGTFYSHSSVNCSTGGALTDEVTPAGGNTYYLVVPHNIKEEGSYGTATLTGERPVGGGACGGDQVIAACGPLSCP